MNTEHAGRQKADEGFPRMGQAIPQGQKGYRREHSTEGRSFYSIKLIEDLGRPREYWVSPREPGRH